MTTTSQPRGAGFPTMRIEHGPAGDAIIVLPFTRARARILRRLAVDVTTYGKGNATYLLRGNRLVALER